MASLENLYVGKSLLEKSRMNKSRKRDSHLQSNRAKSDESEVSNSKNHQLPSLLVSKEFPSKKKKHDVQKSAKK